MKQILYKNSFEGLLSAFHYALEHPRKEFCFECGQNAFSELELFDTIEIEESSESANELLKKIMASGGNSAVKRVIRTFLSEVKNFEKPLFNYIHKSLIKARNIDGDISDPDIRFVVELSNKVATEVHRLKGLLRFKKLSEEIGFYAPFEPDHNIIVPVAMHFQSRLHDQKWTIHDIKRARAVHWDGKTASELQELNNEEIVQLNEMLRKNTSEDKCEKSWKIYTKSVSISERKNPKLQVQNMPKRYWKYLVEMQDNNV